MTQIPSIVVNVRLLLIPVFIAVQKTQSTKYKPRDKGFNDRKDFVKQKVSKIKFIRKNSYFCKLSEVLNNENVKIFIFVFQKQFVLCP